MERMDIIKKIFKQCNMIRRVFVENCVVATVLLGLLPILFTNSVAASEQNTSNDGFKIIILGSGSPTFNKERVSPGLLVQFKDKYYQVDVGAGTVRQGFIKGIPYKKVETMFITHHHSDHNGDYEQFLIYGWAAGREKLNVFGPPGMEKLHQFNLDFYQEDIDYRAKLGRSTKGIHDGSIQELSGSGSFELDGMRISYIEVPHTIYALAYKFEANNRSVVISGDTMYSEDLINFAKDADIFVADAQISPSEFYAKRGPKFKQSLEQSHATIDQVADMAAQAGVKKLVLNHLPPGVYADQMVAEVSKIYKGTIVVAEDLLEITD